MKLPAFEYAEPDSMDEACRTLVAQNGNARIIAGGTELLQAMKNHVKFPRLLVSLERIPSLTEIQYDPGNGLTFGALVTLDRLADHADIKAGYSVIAAAAQTVGGPQLQAMGTVGGNLCQDCCCIYYNRPPDLRKRQGPCYKLGGGVCHAVKHSPDCHAVYSGDLAPVLIALGAQVTLAEPAGAKTIPIQEMYSGNGAHPLNLKPGQVARKIRIPEQGNRTGGAYLKLRRRKAIDYPLLGVAAVISLEDDSESCRSAKVAMTGIGSAPVAIEPADKLQGHPITDDRLAELAEEARSLARPVANIVGFSPRYRRDMVRVYVQTAVKQALADARTKGDPQ
jgi:4-hydroxybenzoyl-CoA reductase subunit beta